ncbi:MAG: PQQ-binding-like beta-propeller repeat protein [Chloroflexota bacterium]
MKKIPTILFFTLLITTLALSACSSKGFVATSWPGISSYEGVAYIAFNQFVYAVDLDSGNELWRFPKEADRAKSFYAAPAITPDGQVIVGSYENALYSLDASSGEENWSFTEASNRFIARPLITEKGIYAPSADGKLYAFDFQGHMLWPEPFDAGFAIWASPTTDGDRIYLASIQHTLYALNINTGKEIWQKDLGGAIVGIPALSPDGYLYVGTFAKEMLTLRAVDGEILHRTSTQGWVWSGPFVMDEALYFTDLSGRLYALNRSSGEIVWTVETDGTMTGAPLVTGESIIVGTENGSLFAYDHNGQPLWKQSIGGKLYTTPNFNNDLVLVTPMDGDALLVALNLNGLTRWSFSPAE